MKTTDLFVKCLKNEGVKQIYGVPGEENESLLFSLKDSGIEFIPTRHEQGAAFMANVHGRLTGRPGVCLSTLGPGATNLVTGVADAFLDHAPLIAISAQQDAFSAFHQRHQYLDLEALFKPITRWQATLRKPGTVPEIVRKAFREAQREPGGPVQLLIPKDVAEMHVENLDCIEAYEHRPSLPDRKDLRQVSRMIHSASRPIVLVGNGVIRSGAVKEFRKWARHLGLPVVSTFMAKGVVSDRERESLMVLGLGMKDYVMEAIEASDLVVTVGYDPVEYEPVHWNRKSKRPVIHLSGQEAEVYREYPVALEVVGDLAACLKALTHTDAQLGKHRRAEWHLSIRNRIQEDIAGYDCRDEDPESVSVPSLLPVLRRSMGDDDLLISDVGRHKMWIARNFPCYEANRCIISNGLASMGIALPGAIAARMSLPDTPVVAVMGDGGFLMNVQELETATRLGGPLVLVVLRDDDYGLISWKQKSSGHEESFGTRIDNPEFCELGRSFGLMTRTVKRLDDFEASMQEALAHDGVSLIEVVLRDKQGRELESKLESYWKEKQNDEIREPLHR